MNPMPDSQPESFINLLPHDRMQSVHHNYFFRLAAVAALMLGALVVMHGVLLIPAYAYVAQDIAAKESHIAALSAANLAPAENTASARLAALTSDAVYLSGLGKIPTMSGATALVLGVPRSGITLTSFTLAPASGKSSLTMTVSGTARTREALHNYVIALEAEPWVTTADLPISAYAADTNVTFAITLSGSFLSP